MSTSIAEYSSTDAALADLRERYATTTYDVTVASGMKAAKEARAVLKTWRVELEAERKRIKAPALKRCQEIDAEARRITLELSALEDPIDELIKKEEGRKEAERKAAEELAAKAEAERLAMARAAVESIRSAVHSMYGKPSSVIADKIKIIESIDTVGYALPDEAAEAKKEALAKLNDMWMVAVDQEAEAKKLASERVKIEAERAAMALEQERMDEEQRKQEKLAAQARAEVDRQRAEVEKREAQAKAELDRQLAESARRETERESTEDASTAVTVEAPFKHEINHFFVEDAANGDAIIVGPSGFRHSVAGPSHRLDIVVDKLNEQLYRIREIESEVAAMHSDPCTKCGTPHDDVAPGPCSGVKKC
jgi:hypothetical protein